jgi:pimeloyl-ACP methyl ester carboxylesterase
MERRVFVRPLAFSLLPLAAVPVWRKCHPKLRPFEVASVKPCSAQAEASRGSRRGDGRDSSPNRLHLPCQTLLSLIQWAYVIFADGRFPRWLQLAAHHATRSRGVVLMSVPYFPEGFALPSLLPLIDRRLYPAERYPDGQWDYFRFYQIHFDQTVRDFDADIPATLASVYRRGSPAAVGHVSPTASVTLKGGRYGSAHRAPATPPDLTLWPSSDFDALVEAFHANGFRAPNAWYLNDAANIAYASAAPDGGRLRQPVLFLNGNWDPICDISRSRLGESMQRACPDLTVTNLGAGHWLPLECKAETAEAIRSWLKTKGL